MITARSVKQCKTLAIGAKNSEHETNDAIENRPSKFPAVLPAQISQDWCATHLSRPHRNCPHWANERFTEKSRCPAIAYVAKKMGCFNDRTFADAILTITVIPKRIGRFGNRTSIARRATRARCRGTFLTHRCIRFTR